MRLFQNELLLRKEYTPPVLSTTEWSEPVKFGKFGDEKWSSIKKVSYRQNGTLQDCFIALSQKGAFTISKNLFEWSDVVTDRELNTKTSTMGWWMGIAQPNVSEGDLIVIGSAGGSAKGSINDLTSITDFNIGFLTPTKSTNLNNRDWTEIAGHSTYTTSCVALSERGYISANNSSYNWSNAIKVLDYISDPQWTGITFGNGFWVAVSNDFGVGIIDTTTVTPTADFMSGQCVGFDGSRFIILGGVTSKISNANITDAYDLNNLANWTFNINQKLQGKKWIGIVANDNVITALSEDGYLTYLKNI